MGDVESWRPTTGADALAPEVIVRLRRAVEREGQRAVILRLGISHTTLARCLAALPVRRGTQALIERGVLEARP